MAGSLVAPSRVGHAGRVVAWIAARQVRWPLRFVAGVAAAALLFGALALRLELRTSFEELLPADQPSVVELRRLQSRVARGSNISIVLEGPESAALRALSGAILARLRAEPPPWLSAASDGIHAVREFLQPRVGLFAPREQLERLRDQLRAAHRSSVMRASGLDLGLEEEAAVPPFEDVRDRLFPPGSALPEVRGRYPDGYFQSADGKALVVLVRTSIPPGHLDEAQGAFDRVRATVFEAEREAGAGGLRVGYAGDLVTGLSEYGAVRADLASVGATGVAMVLGVILLHFRRLRVLGVLGATIAAGLALTFGVTALAIGYLNVASGFLVSIVAGNGINAGIIYAARYFEARREKVSAAEAAAVASSATWLPTFGASVAAAAAYGSLGITHFLGLRHFALIGGAGMLLCWLCTYLITPPLLVLAERVRPLRFRTSVPNGEASARRRGLLAGLERAAGPLTVVALLTTAVAVCLAVRYLRSDPMEYDVRRIQNDLGGSGELRRISRRASEILGANLESSMVVLADRVDQVRPLQLALEARRDQALASERPFESVHTLFDLVAPDQEAKIPVLEEIARTLRQARAHHRIPDAEWERIVPLLPPRRLAPYGIADLPSEVAQPFTEKNGNRGTVVFIEPTAGQSDSDLHYLLRWTDAFRETALPGGERIRGSGRAVIFADMLESIVRDMPRALAASLLATMVAVAITFRRGALSAAVLMALLAGVLWLAALLELLSVKLNFINFVALPVTFGIGVDYALNVVQRYGAGDGVLGAVRRTGPAVVLCSLTTILGYLALLGSINQAVRSLGLVAVLGEACCLTAAVVGLPAALLTWERCRGRTASSCGELDARPPSPPR